ncbi:MAG: hypothetical protein Q8S20_05485 [Sulfuritalea sp.]|nr:hypothetical protein [Sulfuritalea sp.]
MTIVVLKSVGMLVLLIGFVGMLGADRSRSSRASVAFKLAEYWGFGYVALYVTNWWPSAARLGLLELLTMFILLPLAYSVAFWIVGMIVKEAAQRSF